MKARHRSSIFFLLITLLLASSAFATGGLLQRIRGGDSSEVPNDQSPEMEEGRHFVPVVIESNRNRVAYTEFAISGATGATGIATYGQGGRLDCSNILTDAITQRLIDNANYKVVTREHVEKIFEEQQLVWGGGFDTNTGSRLGGLLGVQVLIFAKASYCEIFSMDDAKPAAYNPAPSRSRTSSTDTGTATDLAQSAAHVMGEGRIAGVIGAAGALMQGRQKRRDRQNTQQAADEPPVSRHHARLQAMIYALDLSTGQKVLATSNEVIRGSGHERNPQVTSGRSLMVKAANDIAADFVDRLDVRSRFDFVQMYSADNVDLEPGIRLVRLGDCSAAAQFFDQTAVNHAQSAGDETNGRISHNHGIALMCEGSMNLARRKLRASFRLREAQETLDMINLTNQLEERNLRMKPEDDNIMRFLIDQTLTAYQSASPGAPTISRDPAAASGE